MEKQYFYFEKSIAEITVDSVLDYIAQALVDYIMLLSPRKIILGGGVMHQEQLFPMIRQKVREMLNGYIKTKELEDMDSYIVPASLHDDQGIMGCIKLGLNALQA